MAHTTPVRILVADDQVDILDALRLLLSDEGYEVTVARSPGEAIERLEGAEFDLAILDGDEGDRYNVFTPRKDGKGVTVRVTIASPKLPKSVKYRLSYRETGG